MVITNVQNRCLRCYEPITNPVCIKCHLNEVRFFLNDFNVNPATVHQIILELKKVFREEPIHSEPCLLCAKENLSFCSYCFFLVAVRVIKKHLGKGRILDSFLEVFSYQFGNEEYVF